MLQAVNMAKKMSAYKNRLWALELERTGGATNKKKSHKQMNKYDPIFIVYDNMITMRLYGYDAILLLLSLLLFICLPSSMSIPPS